MSYWYEINQARRGEALRALEQAKAMEDKKKLKRKQKEEAGTLSRKHKK